MILELKCPLVLETPKGKATAYFLIDYGMEGSLTWVCFVHETGENWCFESRDVRLEKNITRGNGIVTQSVSEKELLHTLMKGVKA